MIGGRQFLLEHTTRDGLPKLVSHYRVFADNTGVLCHLGNRHRTPVRLKYLFAANMETALDCIWLDEERRVVAHSRNRYRAAVDEEDGAVSVCIVNTRDVALLTQPIAVGNPLSVIT